MNVLHQFEAAQAKLRRLESKLGDQRKLASRLEQTVDYHEMAKVRLAGGVVFFNTRTLRKLQYLAQETKLMQSAIQHQSRRVEELEGQIQQEREAARQLRREQVVLKVLQSLDDLASSLEELGELCGPHDGENERPPGDAPPITPFAPRKAG